MPFHKMMPTRRRIILPTNTVLLASDTTFQSTSPPLALDVAPFETWDFSAIIRYTASVAADLKFGAVFSGMSVYGVSKALATAATTPSGAINFRDITTSGTAYACPGQDATVLNIEVSGTIIGDASGGQFELRFAANNIDPSQPTILAGSQLTAAK
jgi:hypothetical protein